MSDAIGMPVGRRTARQPWGFWATVGWALLALVAGMLATFAVGVPLMQWATGQGFSEAMLSGRSAMVPSLVMIACVAASVVLVLAARRAGFSAFDYLALVPPRGRYVVAGILCVVLPLLLFFAHAQFDIHQMVPAEHFGAASRGNIWHLQTYLVILSAVIAMPLMEEIVFRGFVYRGFSATRLGVVGTIVITAVLWAVMHINKPPAAIFDTAVHGLIWGWLRWYTGSLWVTIGAHVANNACAVLLSVAAMYGLFG